MSAPQRSPVPAVRLPAPSLSAWEGRLFLLKLCIVAPLGLTIFYARQFRRALRNR